MRITPMKSLTWQPLLTKMSQLCTGLDTSLLDLPSNVSTAHHNLQDGNLYKIRFSNLAQNGVTYGIKYWFINFWFLNFCHRSRFHRRICIDHIRSRIKLQWICHKPLWKSWSCMATYIWDLAMIGGHVMHCAMLNALCSAGNLSWNSRFDSNTVDV